MIIGRIFKVANAPPEPLWMWASGHNGDIRRGRGYASESLERMSNAARHRFRGQTLEGVQRALEKVGMSFWSRAIFATAGLKKAGTPALGHVRA